MLLGLVCIFCVLSHSVCAHHGCGADRIKNKIIHKNWNVKPHQPPSNKHNHHILEGRAQDPDNTGTYNNIRIHYDTSQLEANWPTSYSLKSYFVDDVIPAAFEWLESVISVRSVDGPLSFSVPCNSKEGTIWTSGPNAGKCASPDSYWQSCGDTGAVIPADMFDEMEVCGTASGGCETTTYPQGSGRANTDLVIYFTGDPTKDDTSNCNNVMGFAAYCHSNSRNRPIAGYINLCRSIIDAINVLTWEQAISLIIHQAFHVLGFSSDGFNNFINVDGSARTDVYTQINKRGKLRSVITLPTVVEKARTFFDCAAMDGIELEDYGVSTAGDPSSHWDNRILINDIMISYITRAASYSIFTLAVLEDSGWYNINWEYAQEPSYGRKTGCGWYNDKCITNGAPINDKVFCTEEVKYSCGSSYVGKFYCGLSVWSNSLPSEMQYFTQNDVGGDNVYPDFCPLLEEYSNGDCRLYGDNNIGSTDGNTAALGGLISGNSKCALISGETNGIGAGCYPTECFINYKGDYVGTRLTIYRNYKLTGFYVLTCWSDEGGVEKTFGFEYDIHEDYGFNKIYCPTFTDICYNENPWICNGHGTIVSGSCICSPGYFGIDCTIENNAANKAQYTSTSSVSVYIDTVCNGGVWNYNTTDNNVGILSIVIEGIVEADYVESNFQTALKNWIAILTDISQCDVDLKNYKYNASTLTTDIYYYSSSKTWVDTSTTNRQTVFGKLFPSSYSIEITEVKESTGSMTTIDPTTDPTTDPTIVPTTVNPTLNPVPTPQPTEAVTANSTHQNMSYLQMIGIYILIVFALNPSQY